MPVDTLFNTSPVKEQPAASRRRSEAGSPAGGDGFCLPATKEKLAQPRDKTVVDGGKAAAASTAKATGPGRPAGASATRSGAEPQPAQPDSFIGTLAELVAAAQGRAAPSVAGETNAAVTGDARQETDRKKAEGADAVPSDKAAGEKPSGDATAVVPSPEQRPSPQPDAAIALLALPVAGTAGGGITEEVPAQKSGVVSSGAGSGTKASTPAATVAAPGAPSLPAGEARQAADGDGAAEAKGVAKADAPRTSPSVQVGPAAASEPKPADAVQQALAPIDLGALVQQAVGKAEHMRLLSPLDQAAAANQAAVPGQNPAGVLPATPLHVVPIEIGLRALSGAKQFDIRLDPDELGRVDVNLSISDKGEVSARLVVDRVETLHLLQRDARTLERAFEQAGLKPSDGGVDISLRDPSDQSAFRQHRQQEEAPQRSRPPSRSENGDDGVLPASPVPQRRLVRLGGVDLSI